ncbi:MAG: hypothetical protein NVS3B14_16320 [Ktedonobacteraceae bacterium]
MLDSAVILLESIVEVAIAAMNDVASKGLADRTGIGIMSIGRHSFRRMTSDIKSLREEVLGGIHISLLTEHRVNQVAIPIDGSRERTPVPMNFDIGFIDMPGSPYLPTSLDSKLISHERGKTGFPVTNCFMGERKATFQKHFRQITQA